MYATLPFPMASLLLWHKLVFLLLLQELTEKLFSYMHDLEYRVRRLLSVRAKVFFQTWDGHEGLLREAW